VVAARVAAVVPPRVAARRIAIPIRLRMACLPRGCRKK
jgi:hypothetical protein